MSGKNVLLTGVSSFTGFWFAKELKLKGFNIFCPLPRSENDYNGIKAKRIDNIKRDVKIVFDCSLGEKKFNDLLENPFEFLCLHGAHVQNYESPKFELLNSLNRNLNEIEFILKKSFVNGCKTVLWTSSIFEDVIDNNDENSDNYKVPWLKYALSKKTSYTIVKHLALSMGLNFVRFVISNPFGPFEDKKLCFHLTKSLTEGSDFIVKTPDYVRDMIHVENLAENYVKQISQPSETSFKECRPSEYRMKIFDFAKLLTSKYNQFHDTERGIGKMKQEKFCEPLELLNNGYHSSLGISNDNDNLWHNYFEFYSN